MTQAGSTRGRSRTLRLSGAQSTVLRTGGVILLVAAVLLVAVALFAPSGSGSKAHEVTDPAHVVLPTPGLFGATAVVYGSPGESGTSPKELGCRLLYSNGKAQSTAKLSYLMVRGSQVTVAGQRLAPLFRASSYPAGSYVSCTDASAPLAVSGNDPLHGLGGLIRGFAAVIAVVCLALGLSSIFVLRRRHG